MASKVLKVMKIKGYRIVDSRNNPTVACRMKLSDGKSVFFKVPSGASTGWKEAVERRDKRAKRWRGKDVMGAVRAINEVIAPMFEGKLLTSGSQKTLDQMLIKKDGTDNLRKLGANAILPVSGAFARAKAHAEGLQLWEYFAGSAETIYLPVPQLNVLNAGKHADSGFEIQETMILPVGAKSFAEAMEMGTGVWYALKSILKKAGHSTGRGDEGGFVNPFKSADATLDAVIAAIDKAGYKAGKHILIGFDGAFSEIYGKDLQESEPDPRDKTYHLGGQRLTSEQVADFWADLVDRYPMIASIEDGMGDRDKKGWQLLTEMLGHKVQLVLDDYICTNPDLLLKAIEDGIGNSSLIKLNQIGTVSGTRKTMEITDEADRTNVISHRSGETEDDFIGHFVLEQTTGTKQIKSGSSGSDRNAKYNVPLMAEDDLGKRAKYPGFSVFQPTVEDALKKRL